MIYLIKSGKYLKIGFTDNIKQRLTQYKTNNPEYQVLGIKEGSRKDEYILHKKLKDYLLPNNTEWMYYDEKIISTYNTYYNENYTSEDIISTSVLDTMKELVIKSKSNINIQISSIIKVYKILKYLGINYIIKDLDCEQLLVLFGCLKYSLNFRNTYKLFTNSTIIFQIATECSTTDLYIKDYIKVFVNKQILFKVTNGEYNFNPKYFNSKFFENLLRLKVSINSNYLK